MMPMLALPRWRSCSKRSSANGSRKDNYFLSFRAQGAFSFLRAGSNFARIRASAASCSPTPSNPTVASGDPAQPSAQLSREAGDTLFDIASTGNQAIIALNTCVKQYDEVKAQFDYYIAESTKESSK